MIHSFTWASNQVANYSTQFADLCSPGIVKAEGVLSPYAYKVIDVATPFVNKVASIFINFAKSVEAYRSTHSYASLYCTVVAIEASTACALRLLGALSSLFDALTTTNVYGQKQSYEACQDELKKAITNAAFAALFALGAVNPITGFVVPIVAGTMENMTHHSNFKVSERYNTVYLIQAAPQKIMRGVATVLSTVTFLPKKVTNLAVGALTLAVAVHAFK